MKKFLLSVCIMAASALFVNAQTSVSKYNPDKDLREGIVYSLPMTKLNVAVTATCTVQKAGPFYQYAQRYLATNDVILEDARSWSVSKVDIEPVAVPDPDRRYLIGFDKKGISNNVSFFGDYLIAAVNADPVEVQLPAGLVLADDDPVSLDFDFHTLSEETLTATSIPKMAEMAARQIYRIRESRTALLGAETELMPDGNALKLMIQKLNREERELVALFVGKSASYSVTRVYDFIPRSDMENYIIARLSTSEGLVDADDVIGSPVYLDVKGKYMTAPAITRRQDKKVKGFFYNVPGEAVVSVSYDDFHFSEAFVLPQFGHANFLNPELTKDTSARIVFNPLLGTIISFSK